MAAPLAGLAVLLAFAAAWELAGARGEQIADGLRRWAARASRGRLRSLADAALRLDLPARLRRAGLEGRVPASAVLAAKGAGVLVGAGAAALAAPVLPARLGIGIAVLLPVAGFLAPDALLERAARRRRDGLVAAMPDALDLLAVGVASGRAPSALLDRISAEGSGPLARELAITVAEVECGGSQSRALQALRDRVPGAEVAAFAAALERSRRYGSPLAEQLHHQATGLRRDARRRIEEHAARAAPKIQLVVALVLVPSVLLMILAALIAHSERIFLA